MPATNLISNIGFGEGATHTISPESKLANLGVTPLRMPLRHPDTIEVQLTADRWTSEHVFGIDRHPRLLRSSLKGRLRQAWTRWVG
jgi:hypothetical protein